MKIWSHPYLRRSSQWTVILVVISALNLTINHSFGAAPGSQKKVAPSTVVRGKTKKVSKNSVKVDHNAIGFKAFQKGDFKSALKSFEHSMKIDPKNAFGYLNHARTLVAINIKNDPADYCAYESNWVVLALASLSKAVDVNRKVITSKLSEVREASFKEFKKRPEYKKWEAGLSLPITQESQLRTFIMSHAEWITREAGMPPTLITLRSDFTANVQKPDGANSEGTWKLDKLSVVIDTKILMKNLKLKSVPFYFNEGRSYFSQTVLVDDQKSVELSLGPITEDCS